MRAKNLESTSTLGGSRFGDLEGEVDFSCQCVHLVLL